MKPPSMKRRQFLNLLAGGGLGFGGWYLYRNVVSSRPRYASEERTIQVGQEVIFEQQVPDGISEIAYTATLLDGQAALMSVLEPGSGSLNPMDGEAIDGSELHLYTGNPVGSARFSVPDGKEFIIFRIRNETLRNIETNETEPVSVSFNLEYYE